MSIKSLFLARFPVAIALVSSAQILLCNNNDTNSQHQICKFSIPLHSIVFYSTTTTTTEETFVCLLVRMVVLLGNIVGFIRFCKKFRCVSPSNSIQTLTHYFSLALNKFASPIATLITFRQQQQIQSGN